MKTNLTPHPDDTVAAAGAPFRIKNILVPVDFSDCSKKALQYALPLAQQRGSTLTLLHVVPTAPYATGEQGVVDYSVKTFLQTSSERELAHLVEHEVHGSVPADTTVRAGTPAIEIVELAKSLPADLIVISTHGHSGLKHVFLGSVTEQVVRHAPCPVLVVRECENEFLAG
jgi:nucleotide-binding universal stress UspA family protein